MKKNTTEFMTVGTIDDLSYGVEIEFADAGNLLIEGVPAYDEQTAEENLNDNAQDWLESHLGCDHQTAREMLRHGSLEDFVNGFTRLDWRDMVAAECDNLNENAPSPEDTFDDLQGWDHEQDGTRGIVQEYQSDIGDLSTTINRVEDLFARAGHRRRVPLNGSCHIHCSVPGSRHSASDDSLLHCCLLYELSQQIELFPSRVRERMADLGAQMYFRLDARCTTKFSAIHIHPQGSWEFRIFGGMHESCDISKCLAIAGRAFLAGYRRYICGDYVILDPSEFRERFASAMDAGVPMLMVPQVIAPVEPIVV